MVQPFPEDWAKITIEATIGVLSFANKATWGIFLLKINLVGKRREKTGEQEEKKAGCNQESMKWRQLECVLYYQPIASIPFKEAAFSN